MRTLANFPPELLLRIFSSLSYRDLVCARRTCRQWRDLSMDEGLLRIIKERDFREDKWGEKDYFPSEDEIGLAVFLGRDNLVEMNFWLRKQPQQVVMYVRMLVKQMQNKAM